MDFTPQLGNDNQKEVINETTTHPAITSGIDNGQVPETAKVTTISNQPATTANNNQQVVNDGPNATSVYIVDQSTPIVVLFGPPSCGKTMTLVRLTRYLWANGYSVEPIETFRPAIDTDYKVMCNQFNAKISSNDAAESTKNMNFMLVKVVKDGKTICQILEAPGEGYFKPNDANEPTQNFPAYVNTIINSNNRKIWCFMVEPQWGNTQNDRVKYAQKIAQLKRQLRPCDKAIFVFNKIDKTDYVYGAGKVHAKDMENGVKSLYPSIFEAFITKGIFGKTSNYKVIPFQTGNFNEKVSGGSTYTESPQEYPKMLWDAILDYRKG